jgi:predicted metal-dependent peptidase
MSADIKDSFEQAMCLLLVNNPLCFNMVISIDTMRDDSVGTMGVKVWDGRITLKYNLKFLDALDKAERNFVLIHEIFHVFMHHCTWRQSSNRRKRYLDNVAMDLEINSLITENNFIQMPRYKEDTGIRKKGDPAELLPSMFKYKANLSYEQYRALLTKDFPEDEIAFIVGEGDVLDGSPDGSGRGKFRIDPDCPLGKIVSGRIDDMHGSEYNEDPYADDFIRSKVEQIERNHLWGNAPASLVEKIKKAQEEPIDWSGRLCLSLGDFLSYEKVYTRRRWDKHFGKPFLGNTMKSVEPVAVYTDTSGSVGSADLSRFIVEIESLAHYTQVMLFHFDTEIKNPEEPQLFSREAIESIEFKGHGGTSFKPIFKHAKEHEYTQIVVLTDGEAEAISAEEIGEASVIWVVTKGGSLTGKPGTVIEMTR